MRQHPGATFCGWCGPLYPDTMRQLVLAMPGSNGYKLDRAGKRVEGYLHYFRDPPTDDGYAWFWILEFRAGKGSIRVAFPWAQDWAKKDGVQTDRSPAVYTSGTIDDQEINAVVGELIKALTP